MEKKKAKRPKLRTLLDGHGQGRSAVKQKLPSATSDKEERERLEAANILSSLKFMTPTTPEITKSDPKKEVTANSSAVNVTQFPVTWTTGISTHSTPSVLHHGKQLSSGRSGTAKSLLTPAVLAQLAQVQAVMGTQIVQSLPRQLLSSILTLQARPVAKTQTSQSKVPSVVMSAEPSRLPVTVNAVKTVNKTVASALRQAVALNTTKQNPDSVVMKTMIKEKLQKKITDELPNGSDNQESVSSTSDEKLEPVSKKKDTVETSLPLKKRRLVSLLDNQASNLESSRLSDLTSSVHMDNILNLARDYPDPATYQPPNAPITTTVTSATSTEGYRPVSFDPRTSLLVLSDLKTALTPDEDGDLPIHIAVVHENTELVKKFIDIMAMSGKSVDRYNKLQQTPLHLAVLVNKPDIVEALLVANADPNLVDRNGCTSQHIAITKQFPLCLKKIFAVSNKRVEVNTRNYEGYSPLHTTVENGDLAAMQFLNEQGSPTYINLNIQDGKAGRSVLFYATEYKRVNMVDYLIQCGVNVDLQNYAGISPLMTAQAGKFDKITELLTRALELKIPEDGYLPHTKKFPIAPIPSKAKQIAPDSPMVRSRSNSVSCDTKPAAVSRTSSTSSSSPMDLSLHTKNKSSISYQTRRSRQNSTDGEMKDKISNSVKQKHAQIIAALEGRSVAKQPQSVASALESVKKMSALLNRHKMPSPEINTDQDEWSEMKIKEEPIDIDEERAIEMEKIKKVFDHNQISLFNLNMIKSGKVLVSESGTPNLQEDTTVESLDRRVDMDTVDSPSMPVLSRAVSLTESVQDSSTVVLEKLQDSGMSDSVSGSVHIPQTVEKDQLQDRITSDMLPETKQSNPSPSSSSADKSIEIPMEVDSINSDVEHVRNATELEGFQNSSNKTKSLHKGVESDSEGSEIDIHAIEMDAEHEEGEEIEGSLVIDETVVDEMDQDDDVPTKAHDERNDRLEFIERTGNNDSTSFKAETEKNDSVPVKELTEYNDSVPFKPQTESCDSIQVNRQTDSNDSIHLKSQTEINDIIPVKEQAKNNNSIQLKAQTECNDNILLKSQAEINNSVPVNTQTKNNSRIAVKGQLVASNTLSVEKTKLEKRRLYEECNESDSETCRAEITTEEISSDLPLHTSFSHSEDKPVQLRTTSDHSIGNSELPTKRQEEIISVQKEPEAEPEMAIEQPQEKKSDQNLTHIEDKNDVIDLDSSVIRHKVDQVKVDRSETSDKTGNKGSIFPVGHSGTLYVCEGDNYKPIKIFLDGSVQSSIVLQRMLNQTALMQGVKRESLSLLSSGEILAKASNNSLVQHTVITGSGVVENSDSGSDFTNSSVQSLLSKALPGGPSTSKQQEGNITNQISVTKSDLKANNASTRESLTQDSNKRLLTSDSIPALINSLEITNVSRVKKPPLSSLKEVRTAISSTSNKPVENAEAGLVKNMEQLKNRTISRPVTDLTYQTGIDTKESHSQLKPGSSKKPSTITSMATNRKPGLNAAPQCKLSTTLQSRPPCSTSEGTLTRVNPDIKNKLSKALQSPQRKLSGKGTVVGPDIDSSSQTTRSIGSNLVEEHSNNVQIVTVSDIRP